MSVSFECCVLSGRGLCEGLITCTEESYGYLSVVSVMCCQVEVCATGCSHVQGVLWMSVCCEFCVLSFRGLCDGLIHFTEESYGCLSVMKVLRCQVEVCVTG